MTFKLNIIAKGKNMKEKINEFDFTVKDTTSYSLTITIGDSQKGSSSFKNYDGEYIIGEVTNETLGTGNDLRNTSLVICTTVTDVSKETNRTSVTYFLNDKEIEGYSNNASEDNATIYYTTTIKFN
jgi:hypothetical protein